MIYPSPGDPDQAMTWLEEGWEERFNPASCCGWASILLTPTRAAKILCSALAYPAERICVPIPRKTSCGFDMRLGLSVSGSLLCRDAFRRNMLFARQQTDSYRIRHCPRQVAHR